MINSARFTHFTHFALNKSLLTNAIAAILVGLSYCFINTPLQHILGNVGFYALSCALTNWIAIIMLFEKIPFLYGSGVIPARFEEFKSGIKHLVMSEFFTQENIHAVMSNVTLNKEKWQEIANAIDYDKMYNALVEAIFESKLGAAFFMMGGQKAVEPLKEPVQKKLRLVVEDILADENLHKVMLEKSGYQQQDHFLVKITQIIDKRLADLTPTMVKDIIQKMIRKHLGWLVVWGGVFGGLIGLGTSFV